jgi:hypothetical protein
MSDCHSPWCRELEAILKHGEVRIRPKREGRRVIGYHVDWVDDIAGHGRTYSGDGEMLREAIEAAIIDRFGILNREGS